MEKYKFRAWDKELNKMVYADFWDRNWYGTKQNDENGCHTMYSKNEIRHNCELMQFTGLKDKNGVEIYEGDIVDIIHPCWTNKAIVEFMDGSFIFRSIADVTQNVVIPGYTFMREKWKIEIIGNIHQNKDLLNE